MSGTMLCGLLIVNKPPGCTSRDVVNPIQRIVRPARVGHAGTLDPLARGVLVVALGPATRLIEHVQEMAKEYRGTFLLGRGSSTEDIEGELWELDNPPQPTREAIEELLPQFVGQIRQRPPAYSALRIKGRRAHNLARKGVAVELAPREITVYRITLVDYSYPELVLDITCGSGTYVRSLGRDLAQQLGTEAVMSALIRRSIGPFAIENAISPIDWDIPSIQSLILPASMALVPRKHAVIDARQILTISYGQPLKSAYICGLVASTTESEVVAVDAEGQLIALLSRRSDGDYWPAKNFVARN